MKSVRRKTQRSPQAAARDAFRASVRQAAERALIAKGFNSLKMVDIAAEAGVGVGTIYNYFADKQAVFEAVFAARTAEFDALIDLAIAEKPPCAQLESLVRVSLEFLEQHAELLALFHERGAIGEYDIERIGGELMEQSYRRFLAIIETAISAAVAAGELRGDIPAHAMAAALSGARNGAIYAWMSGRRRERLTALGDHMLTLFFAGARPRP